MFMTPMSGMIKSAWQLFLRRLQTWWDNPPYSLQWKQGTCVQCGTESKIIGNSKDYLHGFCEDCATITETI